MLLERVTRALAPDYEILQEVAGGGMGIVYAARQRRLDRKVAVKILRPEHATAIAVERFLAEGRLLARLAHPNIIPVYDAGEADGLLYYVMEYVEGETLAERLTQGPLTAEAAVALTRDLLAALAAAHALGVVHRDVKPANIFLRQGRALLGDFGIARWRPAQGREYTTPGEVIGTPEYMSPEQRDGQPATTRTDIYAAGLVIWEACSGVRWPFYQDPAKADWSKLPPELAGPVRRALALEPEARWDNATALAAAISSRRRVSARALALAAVLLMGLGAAGYWLLRPSPVPAPGVRIAVERFAGVSAALGDSLAEALREELRGPDFSIVSTGETDPAVLRLGGTVTRTTGGFTLALADRGATNGGTPLAVPSRQAPAEAWRAAVDTLATDVIAQLWQREDGSLPTGALPGSNQGKRLFFHAEKLWSRANWEAADTAYRTAVLADSSCALCDFRLLDIARWLGENQDTSRLRRLQGQEDRFSPVYQSLIQAMATPLPARIDILRHAVEIGQGFYLAQFALADELLHRGALYGHPRLEAAAPFASTVTLAPRFDPGWEHLALFEILQGDRPNAERALATLDSSPAGSRFSAAFRLLLKLGYSWRFLDSSLAGRITRQALGAAGVAGNPDAAAGARLLLMLDAPAGALELGRLLSGLGDPNARRGGLLGTLTGAAALGRLDSVRATGVALHKQGYDAEALLALELEAVLRSFDPDPALSRDAGLVQALQTGFAAGSPRAAWTLGLLALRSGQSGLLDSARKTLQRAAAPASFTALLEAASRLHAGDPGAALQRLPTLPPLEAEADYDDPLLDAVTRLVRSEAEIAQRHLPQAAATLLWQEHVQITGHLIGPPQAGEMAWALGTLVRWRRARLLDSTDPGTAEHCSLYHGVARLWHGAPAPFGARADSADAAARRLGCSA